MKIKVIITGATGMVGEGVLLECLEHPEVEQVLSVSRRPLNRNHAKLREIVISDFFDLSQIEPQLNGYNACFFCLGVSSLGISADEYKHMTYDLTLTFAKSIAKLNSETTFCYVTGQGTDSTEVGSVRWARVKGATENALMKMFKKSYMFRPGFMKASAGQKNVKSYYTYLEWIYPIGRALLPSSFCTLKEVAQAMINTVNLPIGSKQIIEVKEIVQLANVKTN